MTNDPQNNPDNALWRSQKYMKMSDAEILKLSLNKLSDKDRYYIIQELAYRDLDEKAQELKLSETKKEMRAKPWWKYIPLIFALFFLIKQLAGK